MSSSIPAAPAPATRSLSDMLLALAGVMQQLRLRPDGQPLPGSSLASLDRALTVLLRDRGSLTIEVGKVQLLVEGMETNPEFEPLRHLAMQFYDAGIGSLVLHEGLVADEVLTVLRAIRSGAAESLPSGPHVTLRPLRPSGPHASDPWRAFERLVLDDPERARPSRDLAELSVGLELHPASEGFDGRVLELLAQAALLDDAASGPGSLLDRLLLAVPAETLRRLFGPRGAAPVRREFLRAAAPVLSPAACLRLCQAIAASRPDLLSAGALRVLALLAAGADRGNRSVTALEEELLRLADLAFEPGPVMPRLTPEPDRVLKLALEGGIAEPGTQFAADRMIARRQVAPLLALLETVPREDPVSQALRQRLFHPQTVRTLLSVQPVDLESLERLIPDSGLAAAPVLLDALADSRERLVRLRLLDLLARYGAPVGPLALERLDGMPWYVQRNLLALITKLPVIPAGFPLASLLGHGDPRVRHEAITLALANPAVRELVLTQALDSPHEPTVRLALTTLAEECPATLLPQVTKLVVDLARDDELRALAVSALAAAKDPITLRLLRRLVVGRSLAGFGRLAPPSLPMLAAVRGLTTHWGDHPKVATLLEAARDSRDPEIREAARPAAWHGSGTGSRGGS